MELLGINLFEVLHENRSKLPMIQVKQIAKSLIQCLSFISKNRVIHADIKPQNILLQHCYNVRIVDFGSSCLQQKTLFNYIQSRFYRAPQILLGLPYDSKIDIWSAGCVIAQLAIGRPLFPAANDADLLTRIIQIIGLPTQVMIQSSPRKSLFFSNLGQLKLSPRKFISLGSLIQDWSLVSFLSKIFIYEKEKRFSADSLLEHEWICF